MKKTQGSLTIEASLSLTFFMMLFLSFIAIGRYTTTQTRVRHSLNECAIVMSARNNQLVKVSGIVNSLIGIDNSGVVSIVNLFNPDLASEIGTNAGFMSAPYTNSSSVPNGTSTDTWTYSDLQAEVARYFSYNYLDVEYNDVKKLSYSEIQTMLADNGLKDFEVTGYDEIGHTESNKIINDGKLTVMIKYKIDIPFSLGKVLGKDAEPEFNDVVVLKLMK